VNQPKGDEMATFNDLEFKPHPVGDGVMARIFFDNGYGAAVMKLTLAKIELHAFGSYGVEKGLWELAVMRGNNDEWELAYDTSVTDLVEGYLTEDDVTRLLGEVEALPRAE